MFRSRKSLPTVNTSSLFSGSASIIRRASTTDIDKQLSTEEWYCNYEDDAMLDMPQTQEELTLESISAAIEAVVLMSTSKGPRSSLSMGSASILQPFSKLEKKKTNRRFTLFPWKRDTTEEDDKSSNAKY